MYDGAKFEGSEIALRLLCHQHLIKEPCQVPKSWYGCWFFPLKGGRTDLEGRVVDVGGVFVLVVGGVAVVHTAAVVTHAGDAHTVGVAEDGCHASCLLSLTDCDTLGGSGRPLYYRLCNLLTSSPHTLQHTQQQLYIYTDIFQGIILLSKYHFLVTFPLNTGTKYHVSI